MLSHYIQTDNESKLPQMGCFADNHRCLTKQEKERALLYLQRIAQKYSATLVSVNHPSLKGKPSAHLPNFMILGSTHRGIQAV